MWEGDSVAANRLREALQSHTLVVCPIVFTELHAHLGADHDLIRTFLLDLRIEMINVTEEMWSLAGERYALMAKRRRQARGDGPRRVAADFVIGAHVVLLGNILLTSDREMYERNFTELALL